MSVYKQAMNPGLSLTKQLFSLQAHQILVTGCAMKLLKLWARKCIPWFVWKDITWLIQKPAPLGHVTRGNHTSSNIYRTSVRNKCRCSFYSALLTLHVSVPIGGHLQVVCNTKNSKSVTVYVNGSVASYVQRQMPQSGEFKQSACHKI
jgi:hypothetical protein